MKSYILLLGLLLGGFTAYADSTAKKETEAILIGHVVDSRSGEHLPFITITVKGTTIGTTTDVSGHYLLGNLPVGRPLTVVAQSVGYKSAERSVTLGAHSTTELNFELEEQAVDVGEVVVEIDRNSVIRKETPSLVNILNSKLFERTNAATLADGLSFQVSSRACASRTDVRTAASRRYASTVWTATIRKSCSTRGRSSRPSTASTVSNRFPPT